ncbi:selenocysteine-specific translation elongation factor [Corynebacterium sp. NML140438]|uniref:selenocysteine-specific translation elongation factor n=1 Tax=Corynebacterium sp. NML140438 TaxID=1906334 RepID=UPI0008FAEFCD|nr:selenocysteine-specific translation elongation factor [Corynebacterium sp. NML140438]OIR41573.1 selenocysteine-specific translation elongation factor [Corynebacterium sp. NML140438]
MFVVATAGHVDHGKSTLVKALTGMEPDRWDEEKDRGLTIDLGFVWTNVDGEDIAFVDVPGHERFIANMLAGVGPVTDVLFVVAADEGWMQQTLDHRDAINAFGVQHGVIAMTRSDKADAGRRQAVVEETCRNVAGTSMEHWPVVEVSAKTGEGVDELRSALVTMLRHQPAADPAGRIRMWVDRAFHIKGAGTVVTGTLTSGTITPGQALTLQAAAGQREVTVRGIQSEDNAVEEAKPTMRVALNLRGVSVDEVSRGAALCTPGKWHTTSVVDVRHTHGAALNDVPQEVVVHIGTAGVSAKVRPFGAGHARLILEHDLVLSIGDRLVLRGSGAQQILGGVEAIDVDPPALPRRGDGRKRSAQLETLPDINAEIARRVAVPPEVLTRLGFRVGEQPPQGNVAFAGYWIRAQQVMEWKDALLQALHAHLAEHPLSEGLATGAAVEALGLPDAKLLPLVVAAAKLHTRDGYVCSTARVDLGAAELAVQKLEARLRAQPFQAPEARDLEQLGLGTKELAAAERAGRVLRLGDGVVVAADAITIATARLRDLPQPFRTTDARQVLETTRRVAIPLLELLDARGITRQVEAGVRVLA